MATYYSNTSYVYQIRFEVHTVSQDIANNSTRVYWWFGIEKHSSAYAVQGGSGLFVAGLNGIEVLNRSISFSFAASQTEIGFADGFLDIPHNADGSKSFNLDFYFYPQTTASYFPGAMSGVGTYTCANIARATDPVLSSTSVQLGSAVTITATPAVNTFTHKLYYRIGTDSNTLLNNMAAGTQSYSWTTPISFANRFTTTSRGTVTIVLETYNGDTLIGTKTADLTVTVPTSAGPTISNVAISEAVTSPNIATQFSGYVQNRSKLRVVTTATAQYGASISSYSVTVDGASYSGSTVTTNEIVSSGTVTVSVSVTDSRGITTTQNNSITVLEYTAPTLTVAEVVRSDANGTENEAGTNLKFTYNFNISSVNNKNTKSLKLQYKSGNTWTDLTTISAYTGNSSYVTSGITFDTQTTYDVRFVISDFFTSTTVAKQVGPSFVLLDFGAGGRSAAIGQMSSDDGSLEAAIPFKPYGGIHAYDAGESAGSGAWVKVFSVRVLKRYSYGFFSFTTLQSAGGRSGCRVSLQITGAAIADQTIQTFYIDNRLYLGLIRAYKSSTDTFDIYIKKQGTALIPIYSLEYSNSETAQVVPEFVNTAASPPSGAMTPTWIGLHAFPIGTTFESTSNSNPSNNFGGTWTKIQDWETLTVSGSKVVTSVNYDANMHTLTEIKALFNEKYGFTPTLTATDSNNETYTDLGVSFYNGHWEACFQTVVPILTYDGQVAARLSAANQTMRINYTYTTHRTMYKWTRTA